MSNINTTLDERGQRYGSFATHAAISQDIQGAYRCSPNWPRLAPDQKEALFVIAHKIARILNGDPDYSDSWHDIAGYATLVDKRLKAEGK